MHIRSLILLFTGLLIFPLRGETVTVATYNIENFHQHFAAERLQRLASTRPVAEDFRDIWAEALRELRNQGNEDSWEAARIILDARFSPDVLVIQEGARQEDLEYFNRRWLNGAYETLIQFPSNTTRDQHLNLLVKPGFKVIERREQYHEEPDPIPNDRGFRLFARGPVFAMVETPSGYRFWVGTTHQKSKGGNNLEITRWRLREATRTYEIMNELATSSGVSDVMLLGDMNDEIGFQEFEQEAGGDVIAALLGPPDDGMVLATRKLAEAGKFSFGGYWDSRYRNMIDHIVISKDMADQVEAVEVFDDPIATVASDHYPVFIRIRSDPPNASAPQTQPATRPAN